MLEEKGGRGSPFWQMSMLVTNPRTGQRFFLSAYLLQLTIGHESNVLSVQTLAQRVRKLGFWMCVVMCLVTTTWSMTLTLVDPVTSKMPEGTRVRFMDESSGHVYCATVHTHKAKNFLRRGSVRFEFEEPVTITKDEGVVKSSRKKQIIVLGSVPLIAKLADDSVDETIGATKARYVALGAAVITLGIMNGGNVKLKPGYKVEVFPGWGPHSPTTPPPSTPSPDHP
jgi:hypothetical protein